MFLLSYNTNTRHQFQYLVVSNARFLFIFYYLLVFFSFLKLQTGICAILCDFQIHMYPGSSPTCDGCARTRLKEVDDKLQLKTKFIFKRLRNKGWL